MNDEFCRECSNLLYPKEDIHENALFLVCKSCDHFQEAKSHRLYAKNFHARHASLESYAADLIQDPTLPSTRAVCAKCGFGRALYFQSRDNEEDVALNIFYVCCKCYHFWGSQ